MPESFGQLAEVAVIQGETGEILNDPQSLPGAIDRGIEDSQGGDGAGVFFGSCHAVMSKWQEILDQGWFKILEIKERLAGKSPWRSRKQRSRIAF